MTMAILTWLAVALIGLARPTTAAQAAEWASRSIYQVVTDRYALPNGSTTTPCNLNNYCGGTWGAIIDNLDYIQNMGFTALQISPVDKNMPQNTDSGYAYHGYWPIDKYSVNENFGTAADLKNLSDALHARDMYLLVDVVINDMAYAVPGKGSGTGQLGPGAVTDFSQFYPFNQAEYYHPLCNITNWGNVTNYQGCWFSTQYVALPDLDTESEAVIAMSGDWIKSLVANYSIDGLRIDAAKHVDPAFLPLFIEAAGVYAFGEVDSATAPEVCAYSNLTGLENYSVYYSMIQAFTAGNMTGLSQMLSAVQMHCSNQPSLQNFAENQDQTRFASYTDDMALAQNALTFVMMADGIPKIYQGQEQHTQGGATPDNRSPLWTTGFNTKAPLYNLTSTLNAIRNHAINLDGRWVTQPSLELYLDNSTMAMSKGPQDVQTLTVYSNQGTGGGSWQLFVPNAYPPNSQVTELLTCADTYSDSIGHLNVSMNAGVPHVYFPTYNLEGSGLCGRSLTTGWINNSTTTNSVKTSGSDSLTARVPWSSIMAGVALVMSACLL
ncbi:hypothetical protein MMC32_005760 [Xylographa parallela]|nr:hypothetical protein [Xylographa parallela]